MLPPSAGIFEPEEPEGKAQQEKDGRARRMELAEFYDLMHDLRYRRYIWRLLSFTGVFRSTFTGNSRGYFLEGHRNVGLAIMRDIMEACPEMFPVMQREAKDGIYSFREKKKG